MKTSLEHLPLRKQRQLADVTKTICEMAPVEMVILFGSHARGDWVDDPVGIDPEAEPRVDFADDPAVGYFSDYDVMVVVKNRNIADKYNLWNSIEQRLERRLGKTELSLIVHDIREVNHNLENGAYFFGDVKKEGIVLYDSKRFALTKEKDFTPEERLQRARVELVDWFQDADEFLVAFEDAFAKGHWKLGAFLLHQATERYYNTTETVFTNYKPKQHNIEKLGHRVLNLHPGFAGVFPRATTEDDDLFKQLKNAYVDARYRKSYHITPEELAILRTRVLDLRERTDRICKERVGLPASPPKDLQPNTWQKARDEGRTETRAGDVLTVLRVRGIAVSDAERERILAEKDPERLERWLEKAIVAASVGDVIDDPN